MAVRNIFLLLTCLLPISLAHRVRAAVKRLQRSPLVVDQEDVVPSQYLLADMQHVIKGQWASKAFNPSKALAELLQVFDPATAFFNVPPPVPRVIILDADGTLLNNAHKLTPRVESAVRKAQAAGVTVIPATGRARAGPWVDEVLDPLFDRSCQGVFLQGLIVCDEWQCLLDKRLAPKIGRRVEKVCKETGTILTSYCYDKLYYPAGFEEDDRILRYASLGEAQPEPLQGAKLASAYANANKLLVLASEDELPALRPKLERALRWRPARVVKALDWTLEVLPRGSSKGYGVRKLLRGLQVPPRSVMAVGDGENDIEMMKLVGCPVAMGNAAPALKRICRHQVASNEEDGVAEAIERALNGEFSK